MSKELLGKYIKQVDVRAKNSNIEFTLDDISGISSIYKEFQNTKANLVDVTTDSYKVVSYHQFAYNPNTARMGDKIPIALNKEKKDVLVSSIYPVFSVDEQKIVPEYLLMWFKRSEFDRYARFKSHGSAREIFDWDEMCNIELDIPSIDEQKRKVNQYNVINNRINILRKINDNLEAYIDVIFYNMFIKSNNAHTISKLSDIVTIIDNRGKTPPNSSKETPYPLIEIASLRTEGRITTYTNCSKYITKDIYNNWFRSGHPKHKDILMSTVGSLAELKLFWGNKGSIAQNVIGFRCKNPLLSMYLYQYLLRKQKEIAAYEIGSVQASIKVSQIVEYDINIPKDDILKQFDKIAEKVTNIIFNNEQEINMCKILINNILHRIY